jgi:hypothetical protein
MIGASIATFMGRAAQRAGDGRGTRKSRGRGTRSAVAVSSAGDDDQLCGRGRLVAPGGDCGSDRFPCMRNGKSH